MSRRRDKRKQKREASEPSVAASPQAAIAAEAEQAPEGLLASPLPWIALAALAVRFLHLWLYHGDFWLRTPLLDDNVFVSWADAIEKEGWLAPSLGVFHLNPAYPYFLAALGNTVGRGVLVVFTLQHLAGASVPLALFVLSDKVFGRKAALAAAALGALYGPALFYESRFLGEFWIYLFNAASLTCLLLAHGRERPRTLWALGGLCLGFSTVFRPNVLVFMPAVALWAVWSVGLRRSAAAAVSCLALYLLGVWLPLAPFQWRNHAVDPALGWGLTTSSGGVNLFLGNNPEADGLNKAPSFIRYGPGHEYEDFQEEAGRRLGRALTQKEVSRYWTGEVLKWFRDRPGKAAGLLLAKAGFFWNFKEPPDNFFPSIFARFTKLGPIPLVSWGFIAPLGLAGLLWSLRRGEIREYWLLHAYVGAYFAVNVLFYILSRYRFPTAAGLIPFAGYALARLYGDWRIRARGRAAALAALCLACFGLSRLNLIGEEDQAVSHYSMGVIYANQGWKDEAAAEYRKSIAADSSFKPAFLNLGILEAERGKNREAEAALQGALALERDPRQAEAIRGALLRLKARPAGP